uniref:hypothetical protein n=1 Tax=Agathobacter sp. TaxID=2021311 RepID=UPI0040572706
MKKSIANIVFGLLSQIVNILVGFVLPSLIITAYGSEVNGLISSTTQILVYLGLFEAGVGSATIQSLYEPIISKDKNRISSILSATNKYYNKMGLLYLLALIVCAISYASIVETNIPFGEVCAVIFLSGLGSVLNYWGFGKYKAYLQADGKSYIANNITTISFVISNAAKIFFAWNGFSIVFVQAMQVLYYILQTLGIILYVKQKYSWIDLKNTPNYDAISQKNSVLVHQISYLVFSNTDALLLTFFCGLSVVSLYSMYNLVFSTVMNLISTVVMSIVYIFGRLYFENKAAYPKYHDVFESMYMTIGCAVFSTVYIIVIPFMKLYTAGFNDMNYIDVVIPIMFFIMQFLNIVRGAANNLINIAGDFQKTQGRSLTEMGINIVVSLIGVNWFGIYGVLIGSIVALLYRTTDMLYYENHYIMKRKANKSFLKTIVNAIICAVIVFVNISINDFTPNNYFELIIFAVIVACGSLMIYGVVNFLLDSKTIIKVGKELILKKK